MKLREILQWLAKLLPNQTANGDSNFQAGRVHGDLNNSQHTTHQTIYNSTIYVIAGDQPAVNESRPAPQTETPFSSADRKPATPEQHEVLRIMRLSPAAKAYAEEFMQTQFNTIRVKRLNDLECRRTKGWVEACLKNEAAKRA